MVEERGIPLLYFRVYRLCNRLCYHRSGLGYCAWASLFDKSISHRCFVSCYQYCTVLICPQWPQCYRPEPHIRYACIWSSYIVQSSQGLQRRLTQITSATGFSYLLGGVDAALRLPPWSRTWVCINWPCKCPLFNSHPASPQHCVALSWLFQRSLRTLFPFLIGLHHNILLGRRFSRYNSNHK